MDKEDNICKVPLSATIKEVDGKMKVVSAEWADIPADTIAAFLIKRFGVSAIFGGEESD